MTINTEISSIDYLADGGLTVYSYNFPVAEESWMTVYFDGLVQLAPLYSVDLVAQTVTFFSPPDNGVSLTLLRSVPETQEVDYIEGDSFPAETHEGALDKLTMLIQQVQEQLDRTPTVPPGTPDTDYTFPAYVAGKAIMWDPGTEALKNSIDDFDNIVALATAEADSAAASASAASGSAGNAAASEAAAAASAAQAATVSIAMALALGG